MRKLIYGMNVALDGFVAQRAHGRRNPWHGSFVAYERSQARISASGSAGVCEIGSRR